MPAARVERALIEHAAGGDRTAFAQLVMAYDRELQRICFVICGDSDLGKDATQETWSIVWRKLPTLRDPAAFRPWILRIASNQARATVRRRRSTMRSASRLAAATEPDPLVTAERDLTFPWRSANSRRTIGLCSHSIT